ncbi:MAG: hypothetical protein ACM3QZ_00735 [Solirubrobacterales bacterium]
MRDVEVRLHYRRDDGVDTAATCSFGEGDRAITVEGRDRPDDPLKHGQQLTAEGIPHGARLIVDDFDGSITDLLQQNGFSNIENAYEYPEFMVW